MNKKRLVSLLMVVVVSLVGVSFNFNAFAENNVANPNESIYYLTNAAEIKDFKVGNSNKEVKVAKPDTNSASIPENNVNVWVDSSLLGQAQINEKLNNVYKNGGRIIIKGSDLKRNDVRKYFGIDTSKSPEIIETPHNKSSIGKDVVAVGTKSLGMLIYQQNGANNVTNICGSENDSFEEINKAFLYASYYDYISLYKGIQKENKQLISLGATKASAESYSWINVDVNTRTEFCPRLYINTALVLSKNAGNPNSQGEYLYYNTYRSDIDVRTDGDATYCIREANLTNTGTASSAIYGYGPLDRSASTSNIEFSLPWGLTFGFNPESRVAVSRMSGGINDFSVKINFGVFNALGAPSCDFDGMWCESTFEAYGPNDYFMGMGSYSILTYINALTYIEPISYVNGSIFMVDGY